MWGEVMKRTELKRTGGLRRTARIKLRSDKRRQQDREVNDLVAKWLEARRKTEREPDGR